MMMLKGNGLKMRARFQLVFLLARSAPSKHFRVAQILTAGIIFWVTAGSSSPTA